MNRLGVPLGLLLRVAIFVVPPMEQGCDPCLSRDRRPPRKDRLDVWHPESHGHRALEAYRSCPFNSSSAFNRGCVRRDARMRRTIAGRVRGPETLDGILMGITVVLGATLAVQGVLIFGKSAPLKRNYPRANGLPKKEPL